MANKVISMQQIRTIIQLLEKCIFRGILTPHSVPPFFRNDPPGVIFNIGYRNCGTDSPQNGIFGNIGPSNFNYSGSRFLVVDPPVLIRIWIVVMWCVILQKIKAQNMSANPILMSQLKQILLLFAQGHSIQGIVRETGISHNTVKGYLPTIKIQGNRSGGGIKQGKPPC